MNVHLPWSVVRRAVVLTALGLLATRAQAGDPGGWGGPDSEPTRFRAHLTGLQETPSIITPGTGTLMLAIAADGTITYELTFADLSTPAVVAHIHVGQRGVAGGVSAFLCGGGSKPACPAGGGTVTGTIVAADVLGPAAQNIQPGQLDKLVTAIRAGVTYANVHSTAFPAGEIRGQIVSARHAFDPTDD